MNLQTFALAIHYLKFYRRKFWVLAICGTLTTLLPLGTYFVFQKVDEILNTRAEKYPVVIGSKGSALGLVFHTLFYTTEISEQITFGVQERIRHILDENQLEGYSIPILTGYQATGGAKIVGVSADFYEFAHITFAQGNAPTQLGEVVLGASVAQQFSLKPGQKMYSDVQNLFNLASSFRSILKITGILAPTGGPEDHIILCDVKTLWLLEGIYHGHKKEEKNSESGGNVLQIGVPEYVEVTPETINTFHPHGDPNQFPVTAFIFVPSSEKAKTLVQGLLNLEKDLQAVAPKQVIHELLSIIFQIKQVLNGYFVLVIFSTILLFALVLFLSLRLREKEFQTIRRMGGSRGTLFLIVFAEYTIIFLASIFFATLISLVGLKALEHFGYAYLF